MGWDIVAIGTHHTLPIQNPVETAQRLAPILDGIVSVGYTKRYNYDKESNIISESTLDWIELNKLNLNPNGWRYTFEINNEDARRIHPLITSLDDVTWIGDYTKEFFLDDLFDPPYEIYRIEADRPRATFYLDIFIENIEFDVSFNGRWFTFEDIFKKPYLRDNKQKLDDFRSVIYAQLKVTGCDNAFYFPDQGFGEALYDTINLPSDEWLVYMLSRQYIKDDDNSQVIIKMSDYITGKIVLSPDQNVICIIDDFSDMIN